MIETILVIIGIIAVVNYIMTRPSGVVGQAGPTVQPVWYRGPSLSYLLVVLIVVLLVLHYLAHAF